MKDDDLSIAFKFKVTQSPSFNVHINPILIMLFCQCTLFKTLKRKPISDNLFPIFASVKVDGLNHGVAPLKPS